MTNNYSSKKIPKLNKDQKLSGNNAPTRSTKKSNDNLLEAWTDQKDDEKGSDSSKKEKVKEESKARRNVTEKKKTCLQMRNKRVDYEILAGSILAKNGKLSSWRTKPQRYFSTLMRVLSIFDRDDLTVVYQLVMDKYQDEIPEGVHTLMTDAGLVIHMLIEKKYPLRKKVLLKMLELKLESEEDSIMALQLIRFVKKQIAELEPEDSDGDKKDL
ncbi:hypothetical protein Tco_0475541 [Tanacetum coccineum]